MSKPPINADRIIWKENTLEELRRLLGEQVPEEVEDEIFDPEGLDYPWPITIESVSAGVDQAGQTYAEVVISFDEIPNATSYEVRVTLDPVTDQVRVLGPGDFVGQFTITYHNASNDTADNVTAPAIPMAATGFSDDTFLVANRTQNPQTGSRIVQVTKLTPANGTVSNVVNLPDTTPSLSYVAVDMAMCNTWDNTKAVLLIRDRNNTNIRGCIIDPSGSDPVLLSSTLNADPYPPYLSAQSYIWDVKPIRSGFVVAAYYQQVTSGGDFRLVVATFNETTGAIVDSKSVAYEASGYGKISGFFRRDATGANTLQLDYAYNTSIHPARRALISVDASGIITVGSPVDLTVGNIAENNNWNDWWQDWRGNSGQDVNGVQWPDIGTFHKGVGGSPYQPYYHDANYATMSTPIDSSWVAPIGALADRTQYAFQDYWDGSPNMLTLDIQDRHSAFAGAEGVFLQWGKKLSTSPSTWMITPQREIEYPVDKSLITSYFTDGQKAATSPNYYVHFFVMGMNLPSWTGIYRWTSYVYGFAYHK